MMRRPSSDVTTALGLALACTAVYALCGGGRFFSVDEVGAFQLTRLWLEGEPIASSHVTWAGPDGRVWTLLGPLLSVAAGPGYLFGRLLGLLLPATWSAAIAGPVLGDIRGVLWGGEMRIVGASLTNAWVTGAVVALLFLWLRSLGIARGAALLTAVAAASATLLFAHSKNLFSHGLETLGLLGAVLALGVARARPSVRGFAVAGAWTVALVLTRVQAAVMLPALVAYAWWAAGAERRIARAAAFAGVAALGPLLFAAWNLYRFGALTEVGYTHFDHFSFDLLEASYGHLFSVGRSLFIYSPPVALALLGWPEVLRRHRAEGLLVLGACGGLFVLYASWSAWHGAWCFGNRYLLPTVPLLLVGLPYILPDRPSVRACALGLAIGAGLVVQTLGLAVHIAFIHHDYGYAEHPAPLPYLFVPSQSQLATHADALWRGYALDPWLLRLASDVGAGAALALALPLVLAAAAGALVMYRGPRSTGGGAESRGPVAARRGRRGRS